MKESCSGKAGYCDFSRKCSKEQVRQGWGWGGICFSGSFQVWYRQICGPQISPRFRALEFMAGLFKRAYAGGKKL